MFVASLCCTNLRLLASLQCFDCLRDESQGNTLAQVARSKVKVATLGVLLPRVEGISFKDVAAFEETYQAYKQCFSRRHQDAGELLAAWELALQLGDADLTLAIQAKQTSQNLLEQLIGKYPLAAEAI